MRISDFLLLTLMSAVMITGLTIFVDDVNTNYPNSINVSQLDVMNITAVESSAADFESDVRSAQNGSFVSNILNGIGAAGSLVGLTMTSVSQLAVLAGAGVGTILGITDPNGVIEGLLIGALMMIIALLIISIPFRWELTK
tara:strand:- start:2830 stop:3252 length:423 start_codon:yes stop_codon:yes gene_type:complete